MNETTKLKKTFSAAIMMISALGVLAAAGPGQLPELEEGAGLPMSIDWSGTFNERLSDSDKMTLENGGVVLRSVSSMKKLCVRSDAGLVSKLVVEPMSEKIKSGYIAEIINFRPYKGNEDLIERINEAMSDFLSYTDIQFFSERHQRYFPLYNYAEVTGTKVEGNKTTISEILEMSMFGRFHSEITVENNGDHFLYKLKNTDKLKFKGLITVIKPEGMCSVVAVFRTGENWMIYAVGGANIVRIPIVNMRAEPAFTSRVKAFADFVFKKIDKTGTLKESTVDKSDAAED